MTRRRRSSRKPACASSASARPRSASSERSWNSSKSTAATPSSAGSSRIMRAKTPSVTTSMRVRGPTFEPSRTRKPTVSPTSSPSVARHAVGRGAGREAAGLEHDQLAVRRPTARRAAPAEPASSCRRRAARRAPRSAERRAPPRGPAERRRSEATYRSARIAGDNAGAVERRKRLRWGVLAIRDLIFSGARTVCGENNTG